MMHAQVFIQYSKSVSDEAAVDSDYKATILQRRVVVAKNPCLHPGDVRTLTAVDAPQLHHIFDCIVFPSQGDRPHPNELSGSDLDGDLYHVIWDDELMPKMENKEAMDYDPAKKMVHEGQIGVDEMIDHMCSYIENDVLGQIDNTHKALADQLGIESEQCLELAKMHAFAVDAPKTGAWQKLGPEYKEELKKYPDFMLKFYRPSYPSEQVLGKMYRECNKYISVTMPSQGWWRNNAGQPCASCNV